MTDIDWTTFDQHPESTCGCACGEMFRSHAKGFIEGGKYMHVSRKPCPKCGKDDALVRISSDPEIMTIG